MQNTQPELFETEAPKTQTRATIALSLIVHGEAVRYNRGKSGGRYDFKHMIGARGAVVPYVSAQCFKKHWRETLPFTPSPIIREKDSKGQDKNQAFTSGDPMRYVDDDLFGYMIAGAAEVESEDGAGETSEESEVETPDALENKLSSIAFSPDQLKTDKTWIGLLQDDSNLLVLQVLDSLETTAREEFQSTQKGAPLSENLRDAIIVVLNGLLDATTENDIFTDEYFPDLGKKTGAKQAAALKVKNDTTVRMTRLELLQKAFDKGFEKKKKRETTRRTAPVRMHALVAFSGIKTAEDFQTFSRDISLTGKNSILNPNLVGIYSGWLKTRVLIEAFRVGKFFIGGNMDILADQIGEYATQDEANPYDRENKPVKYIQITDDERKNRVGVALQSLGNIGNAHGPASSALHDGSMKPKAFIGAAMNCADSPFDSVWEDNDGTPRLNFARLKAVLRDWDDLFLDKTIYIGVSPEMLPKRRKEDEEKVDVDGKTDIEIFAEHTREVLQPLGFNSVVDTPRRAFKQMAEQIAV